MMKLMIEAVRFTARTKTFIMSSKVTFIFSLHKALPPFPRPTAGRGLLFDDHPVAGGHVCL